MKYNSLVQTLETASSPVTAEQYAAMAAIVVTMGNVKLNDILEGTVLTYTGKHQEVTFTVEVRDLANGFGEQLQGTNVKIATEDDMALITLQKPYTVAVHGVDQYGDLVVRPLIIDNILNERVRASTRGSSLQYMSSPNKKDFIAEYALYTEDPVALEETLRSNVYDISCYDEFKKAMGDAVTPVRLKHRYLNVTHLYDDDDISSHMFARGQAAYGEDLMPPMLLLDDVIPSPLNGVSMLSVYVYSTTREKWLLVSVAAHALVPCES